MRSTRPWSPKGSANGAGNLPVLSPQPSNAHHIPFLSRMRCMSRPNLSDNHHARWAGFEVCDVIDELVDAADPHRMAARDRQPSSQGQRAVVARGDRRGLAVVT
mmetsp:Transcript_32879/g.77107  ORF Transcript_32879/g.77107 Transcript_32879/m.77107 type:complete len:104 (+) Transcript_32879:255-566(+)